MDNPNEYNETVYAFASQELHNDVATHVEALWAAGATINDVKLEIESALDEALLSAGIIEGKPHTGGGPKKPKA